MSLSQILNTEASLPSAPGPSRRPSQWRDRPDEHRYRYNSPPSPPPSSSATQQPHNDWHDDQPVWHRNHLQNDAPHMHPEYSEHPVSSDEHYDDAAAWRKKRKNTHDETDYQAGSSKRVRQWPSHLLVHQTAHSPHRRAGVSGAGLHQRAPWTCCRLEMGRTIHRTRSPWMRKPGLPRQI